MAKEKNAYFEDIIYSIEKIEFHTREINSFKEFESNPTIIDAVQRRISIIGEALWQADKIDKTIPITNKTKIIGLRHILIHDYDMVNPIIIWKIIEKDISLLKA